jgi:hypothetical protein
MEEPLLDGLMILVDPVDWTVLLEPGIEVTPLESLVGVEATATPTTASDRRAVKALEKNMVACGAGLRVAAGRFFELRTWRKLDGQPRYLCVLGDDLDQTTYNNR